MPTRPPRLCNKCRRPAPSGRRCICTPAWTGTNRYTGSGSTRRWRNLRAAKLKDQPICEHPGCSALASEVDHIEPVGTGGDRYDWTNLQSLCHTHHAEKTAAEALAARKG
ncbi:HNH endonuclease [Nocardia wallacei]|uniref:HNH endonuclease n=1 Tax=Nocardia wallacei TaxID=480035 RepID=UPI002453D11B|nr:HNH endonuclease signature motif containing protein [Nocardia wallacei]